MSNNTSDLSVRNILAGKMSRRRFLETTTAVIGGIAAGPMLIAEARAAVPKKGGIARIGMVGGSSGDTLDPARAIEQYMYSLTWGLRNNLTEVTPNADIVPELAEAWDASADLMTWTFRLRRDIEFHNGKTMTADDVLASMNHHRGETTKSAGKGFLTDVVDIEVVDKSTVVFHLKRANADFPALLTDMHLNILPADQSGGLDLTGVGTGPFILQEFVPGSRAILKRNPNYWKTGRGHFDGVELLAINDPAARSSALRSGAIDIMNRVDPKTVALLANVPGIRIVEVPSGGHFNAPMLVEVPPFDNVDVRLALKYAIDRDAIIKGPLNGHAAPGNDTPIGPTYKYYASDIPTRAYDPDKAKFHMRKAGHQSLKVDLVHSVAVSDGAADVAALIKEHARAAGIDVSPTQAPADGYWSNVWRKKPWIFSRYSGRATEAVMFSWANVAGAGANETGWSNERFESLLEQSLKTVDENIRREIYREMQQILRDQGATITYAFPNNVDATSSKVQHDDKVAGIAELDGYRVMERWWFA